MGFYQHFLLCTCIIAKGACLLYVTISILHLKTQTLSVKIITCCQRTLSWDFTNMQSRHKAWTRLKTDTLFWAFFLYEIACTELWKMCKQRRMNKHFFKMIFDNSSNFKPSISHVLLMKHSWPLPVINVDLCNMHYTNL